MVGQQFTVVGQQFIVVSQQFTVVSQQSTVVGQQSTVVGQQSTVVGQMVVERTNYYQHSAWVKPLLRHCDQSCKPESSARGTDERY